MSVAAVVKQATARFGSTGRHTVETAFDALVMDLGGKRHGDPPQRRAPYSTRRVLGLPRLKRSRELQDEVNVPALPVMYALLQGLRDPHTPVPSYVSSPIL